MNLDESQEVLNLILEIRKLYPQLRLCQIISNAVYGITRNNDIFYVDDETLKQSLQKYLDKINTGTLGIFR